MLASAIVLIVTFIAIFTEEIHGFHRAKVAMVGAGVMVFTGEAFGFYDQKLAVEIIDWNVIFLLGAMMTLVAIMIPTGGFQALAYYTAELSKGRLYVLLAMLGMSIAVLSLFLNNVTTVIIFGPLIMLICQALRVSPVPFLMTTAILSNIGGVATLVGDPPNLMIGSAAGIDFTSFLVHMGGIVLVACLLTLACLSFLFRKRLNVIPEPLNVDLEGIIKSKRIWYSSLLVLGGMIVLFVFQGSLGWDAWVIAALGMTVLLFIANKISIDDYIAQTELSLLVFLVALFVIIGGVEESHFLQYLGQFIEPFVKSDILVAAIVLMWVGAFFSAAIDNIPFTAAMIPIILGLQTQGIDVTVLWWSLAIGVGLGGNATHLGSAANVFVVSIAERAASKEGKESLSITPWIWFKNATPATLVALFASSVIMWIFFPFFSAPVHG
ncbi:MAG: arsenic transporter [Rhodospirillales bacterium]|nr:arsenic transporter [Alphaproteobacteria bacterium]USO04634.1 MAG: arsenic transporter [Rhodospirillales bacterium]